MHTVNEIGYEYKCTENSMKCTCKIKKTILKEIYKKQGRNSEKYGVNLLQ